MANIIAESDHYVIVAAPVDGYYDIDDKAYSLRLLEDLLAKGYRPLHYESRQRGFVCEKPGVRATKASAVAEAA